MWQKAMIHPGAALAGAKRLALLLWLLASASPAAAGAPQTGTTFAGSLVRATKVGTVPASGLAVTLVQHTPRRRFATLYTDSQGRFVFRDVRAGEYFLEIRLFDKRIMPTTLIRVSGRTLTLRPIPIP